MPCSALQFTWTFSHLGPSPRLHAPYLRQVLCLAQGHMPAHLALTLETCLEGSFNYVNDSAVQSQRKKTQSRGSTRSSWLLARRHLPGLPTTSAKSPRSEVISASCIYGPIIYTSDNKSRSSLISVRKDDRFHIPGNARDIARNRGSSQSLPYHVSTRDSIP